MADKKHGIDQALIRDLANILNETDLTEIEVEQDDLRIRVSRAGTPSTSRPRSPPRPSPHRLLSPPPLPLLQHRLTRATTRTP